MAEPNANVSAFAAGVESTKKKQPAPRTSRGDDAVAAFGAGVAEASPQTTNDARMRAEGINPDTGKPVGTKRELGTWQSNQRRQQRQPSLLAPNTDVMRTTPKEQTSALGGPPMLRVPQTTRESFTPEYADAPPTIAKTPFATPTSARGQQRGANALTQAFEQGLRTAPWSKDQPETIARTAMAQEDLPTSASAQRAMDPSQGFWTVMRNIITNPQVMGEINLQSMGSMMPEYVVNAISGGKLGGLVGVGAARTQYFSDLADGLRARGVNVRDPQAISRWFDENPADAKKLTTAAMVSAGIVGAVEGGLNAATNPIGKAISKAGTPILKRLAFSVLGLGIQTAGAGGGEVLRQIGVNSVNGSPLFAIDQSQVAAEMAGEVGGGAIEVFSSAVGEHGTSRTGGKPNATQVGQVEQNGQQQRVEIGQGGIPAEASGSNRLIQSGQGQAAPQVVQSQGDVAVPQDVRFNEASVAAQANGLPYGVQLDNRVGVNELGVPQMAVAPQDQPVAPQEPAQPSGDTIIGRTWESTDGTKRVVAVLDTPRGPRVEIAIGGREAGAAYNELVPVEELDRFIAVDEQNAQSRQRFRAEEDARKAKEDAERQEYENTDGFADGMPSVTRNRVLKTLDARVRDGQTGQVVSRKDFVRKRVADGYTPAERGGKYRLVSPDGSWVDVTKTEHDYAAHLIAQAPAPVDAVPPQGEAVPAAPAVKPVAAPSNSLSDDIASTGRGTIAQLPEVRAVADSIAESSDFAILNEAYERINTLRWRKGGAQNTLSWDVWSILDNDWENARDIPAAMRKKAAAAQKRIAKAIGVPLEGLSSAPWMFAEGARQQQLNAAPAVPAAAAAQPDTATPTALDSLVENAIAAEPTPTVQAETDMGTAARVPMVERFSDAERAALERIRNRKPRGVVGDVSEDESASQFLADVVTVGNAYFREGMKDFAAWADQMRTDLGDQVEEYLQPLWDSMQRARRRAMIPDRVGDQEVNQFQQTVAGSPIATDELAQAIVDNLRTYGVVSNQTTVDAARARIQAAREAGGDPWAAIAAKDTLDEVDVAVGLLEMAEAMAQDDTNVARTREIADVLSDRLTKAGRTVQAASILGRMTATAVQLKVARADAKYRAERGLPSRVEEGRAVQQSGEALVAAEEDALDAFTGEVEMLAGDPIAAADPTSIAGLLRRAMRDQGITLSNLIRTWYQGGARTAEALIRDLAQSGLTEEDAARIANYAAPKLLDMVSKAKREALERVVAQYGSKIPKPKQARIDVAAKLFNTLASLGGFRHPEYLERVRAIVQERLGPAIGEKVDAAAKSFRDIVRAGKLETEANKVKFLERMAARLNVPAHEAQAIMNAAMEAYEEQVRQRREEILRSMAPRERAEVIRSTAADRLMEINALDGFSDPALREYVQASLGVNTLTDSTAASLAIALNGRSDLIEANFDPDAVMAAIQQIVTSPAVIGRGQVKLILDTAKHITDMARNGDDRALVHFVDFMGSVLLEQATQAVARLRNPVTGFDKWGTIVSGGILSGPSTQFVNLFGNTQMGGLELLADIAATLVPIKGKRYGPSNIPDIIGGYFGSIPQAIVEANFAAHGLTRYRGESMDIHSRAEFERGPARVFNLPFRQMSAVDAYFKALSRGGRASIEAIAQAQNENPTATREEVAAAADAILRSPSDEIVQRAEEAAGKATFTSHADDINRTISNLFNYRIGPDGLFLEGMQPLKFMMRYINTPYQLAKYGAVDLNPFAAALRLATFNKNSDPQEKARIVARAVIGSAIYAALLPAAMKGDITGDMDKEEEERTGKKRYHVYINGVGIPMYFFGPVAFPMVAAAVTGQVARKNQGKAYSDADWKKMVQKAVVGFGQVSLSSGPMSTLNGLIMALNANSYSSPTDFAENLLSGYIPLAGFRRTLANASDPWARETENFGENLLMGFPGLRQTLPQRIDRLGRPVENTRYRGASVLPFIPARDQRNNLMKGFAEVDMLVSDKRGTNRVALEGYQRKIELTPTERREYVKSFGEYLGAALRADGYYNPDTDQWAPEWRNGPIEAKKKILEAAMDRAGDIALQEVKSKVAQRLANARQRSR